MSKSLIYMANTNAQALAIGGVVNFGSVVRRFGCNLKSTGTTPQTEGVGYYSIDTNITLTAAAAGTVTLTLFKDGVPITGAAQSATVVANSIYAFNVPAVIREQCCNKTSIITLVVTGVATTVNNATIEVEKE